MTVTTTMSRTPRAMRRGIRPGSGATYEILVQRGREAQRSMNPRFFVSLSTLLIVGAIACAPRQVVENIGGPAPVAAPAAGLVEPSAVFKELGLLTQSAPVAFAG